MHGLFACELLAHVSVLIVTQGLATIAVAVRMTPRVEVETLNLALTFILNHAWSKLELLSILCQVTLLQSNRVYHPPTRISVVPGRLAVLSLHF